jgi:hypothetical protein
MVVGLVLIDTNGHGVAVTRLLPPRWLGGVAGPASHPWRDSVPFYAVRWSSAHCSACPGSVPSDRGQKPVARRFPLCVRRFALVCAAIPC